MTISPSRNDLVREPSDPTELLIKEARQARRRRRRRNGAVAFVALVIVVAGSFTYQMVRGDPPAPRVDASAPKKAPPVFVIPLPARSKIWTLDMMNGSSGYAVAGPSSKSHDERLLETANAGASWKVVGSLPYSFVAGNVKPLLHFVTPSIGYTQAFTVANQWESNNVYVTTNGGRSWTRLAIPGLVPSDSDAFADASTSPDFRFASGVLTLVSLKCSTGVALRTYGNCPPELSQYRWGDRRAYSIHGIGDLATSATTNQFSTFLLAAPTKKVALVASQSGPSGSLALALTLDAGATWTSVKNPCKPYPEASGPFISGVTVTSTRWILSCSQGTGMNHATVSLNETTNDGHSWTTLNYTPAWSARSGAIAGEIDQIWASNGGEVLWSYSSLGFVQVSSDGGRLWDPIRINGRISNSNTGGAPTEFDPVGHSGAYWVTSSGQILLTRDGTNFTPLTVHRT